MAILFLLLVISDVLLASAVFVSLAKPDLAIAFAFQRMGLADPWFEDHISDVELVRLRKVARMFSLGGLVAVFGWSFLVGALMALRALATP
ncbi:MAG: hypothetical protein GY913_15220 [Proteobacteria bacterium]|nr:hypothetical protein [Pseudomonadota bacterium]MCP4918260.1 hypothetical protein [Pseudomonadota bacterium]